MGFKVIRKGGPDADFEAVNTFFYRLHTIALRFPSIGVDYLLNLNINCKNNK